MRLLASRFKPKFHALAAIALLALGLFGGTVRAEEKVNYDDPNLAFTNSFVGDLASSCPSDMAAADLKNCLREKGLAPRQEVARVPTETVPSTR